VVEALGNTSQAAAVPFLEPLLRDPARELGLRKAALEALVKTRVGSDSVLRLVQGGLVDRELAQLAVGQLRSSRWPDIKSGAQALAAGSSKAVAQPLPPIAELCKGKGDPVAGAQVFSRETVGCSKCHQVNGVGVDFGPSLSEIGTKLAKEAIFEAILDPSAGIAFGYEAWQLELKNGDEAFGLLASETADEIAIKAPGGIVTRYKKSDVLKKTQQKTSIMPSGLEQTMSQQDLVDLVEYLASLKKAPQTAQQR
jgi:putative heme-binding domain-containing protein